MIKPKVFIGSSTEALMVAQAVKQRLCELADITIWTDSDYHKGPGEFFLDSLAAAPGRFDFAVLVFGRDDGVIVRGKHKTAPRDNVIFELGLFWSHLGRERTFVLVPRARRDSYRILTDLHGLTLSEFAWPARADDTARCVTAACNTIGLRIRELDRRDIDTSPKGVSDIGPPLGQLMREAIRDSQPVVVRNIALDMEATWPMLRERILAREPVEQVTWRSLMVDAKSKSLVPYWSDTVSQETAALIEANMQRFCDEHLEDLKHRGVKFECRAYDTPPTVHGFLFNDSCAFLSLCAVKNGRLLGAPNPYMRLDRGKVGPRNDAAAHLITAFSSWFEHQWNHGSRAVWPL